MELIEAGVNDCEVARRTGIPRTTVRDWRRPTYLGRRAKGLETCARCWKPSRRIRLSEGDYAELLAVYLCDGHVSSYPRAQRLRIFLDSKYPQIVEDCRALLGRCFPDSSVGCQTRHNGSMSVLWVYSKHLECVFPQCGPGKKHERKIELEPWQRELVSAEPWRFLRGCIRTDGCCFINRTGPYEYLSYDFTNCSADIIELFSQACEGAGVEYRVNCWRRIWHVRINRRASVNRMLEHVGRKE